MTTPSPNPKPAPPKTRYYLAAALVAVGVLLGPGMVVWTVMRAVNAPERGVQFAAPGEMLFRAPEAGSYLVWVEERGVFDGAAHVGTLPPDLKLSVAQDGTGQAVPLRPGGDVTLQIGGTHRRTFAAFDAPAPGDYRIHAATAAPRTVLYVAPDNTAAIFVRIFGAICGGLAGLALMATGAVVGIVTAVQRAKTG